ncbi:MAG: hypothetical protein WDA21_05370, partial [Bacilli bacterium]
MSYIWNNPDWPLFVYDVGEVEKYHGNYGRMSKTKRNAILSDFETLPEPGPRILVATGKLIGEGF